MTPADMAEIGKLAANVEYWRGRAEGTRVLSESMGDFELPAARTGRPWSKIPSCERCFGMPAEQREFLADQHERLE